MNNSFEVADSSEEYEAVTKYFLHTLKQEVKWMKLERLQNREVYNRYLSKRGLGRASTAETIMFHGCKSLVNEGSIKANGFQISKCSSGGRNYGTWFAYGANYSNDGYALTDEFGARHLFVSVVTRIDRVKDNVTMRVVGQDCAYPMWLLQYELSHPPPRPSASVPLASNLYSLPMRPLPPMRSPFPPQRRKRNSRPGPTAFFEIVNGVWTSMSVKGAHV